MFNHLENKIYSFTENPPRGTLEGLYEVITKEENNILAVTHPDLHGGVSSLPIGSTIATLGQISPNAVGSDINCGVLVVDLNLKMNEFEFNKYKLPLSKLIKENLLTSYDKNEEDLEIFGLKDFEDFENQKEFNFEKIEHFENFEGNKNFKTEIPIDEILNFGTKNLKNSFQYSNLLSENNLSYFEFEGSVTGNSLNVSQKAKSRGIKGLNSVGSGNHYVEIVKVDEIINFEGNILPFEKNSLLALIHTGSRGLGHQVCNDFVNKFNKLPANLKIMENKHENRINAFKKVFDKSFNETYEAPENHKVSVKRLIPSLINFQNEKENIKEDLLFMPLSANKPESTAMKYLSASNSAMNYAYTNRLLLANDLIRIFETVFKVKGKIFCDSSHNSASIENYDNFINLFKGGEYELNKENICYTKNPLVIHRKGSTKVLPPNFFNSTDLKSNFGMPFVVGGSCFTNSYILFSKKSHLQKLCSDAHGSGRVIKRGDCKKLFKLQDLDQILRENQTTLIGTEREMITENGFCYKDVNEVFNYLRKVEKEETRAVKLKPLLVLKG